MVHALACLYVVMDARGTFGEQKRRVRVARGGSWLEVGFGLLRIIFTLPKRTQKELARNSTEILQLL